MNRKFTYHEGKVTEAHEANDKQVSDPQTTLVKQIEFADGRTIQYEYDKEERITKVIDSIDGTYEYTYDALGQLLTEKKNNVTVNTMTYDKYGNIATKNGKTYTYDATWKDKLLSTGDGSIGNYDLNGNPKSYLGNTLAWEKGRQLKTFGTNSYKYNNEGIRIKKTTSSEIHEYILDGTNIVKEIITDICNCPKYINEYLYDLDGTVCGIKHNGTAYYFYKNLQGDIIAITDDAGVTVARYTYDAWGKVLSVTDANGTDIPEAETHIANINPFRYRGYYYDTETNLYYLQSRYYNPEVGRFINADDPRQKNAETTNVIVNSFAYCSNSPTGMSDPHGTWGRKTIGYGIQVMLALRLLFVSAIFGIEVIWYKSNYGSHKKSVPWFYFFYGINLGVSFDPSGLLGDIASYSFKNGKISVSTISSLLNGLTKSNSFSKLSVKGAFNLSASIDISMCLFNVTAKKFENPGDYTGMFYLSSKTVFGITGSVGKDSAENVITKGVGLSVTVYPFPLSFSLTSFGSGGGQANYKLISKKTW